MRSQHADAAAGLGAELSDQFNRFALGPRMQKFNSNYDFSMSDKTT